MDLLDGQREWPPFHIPHQRSGEPFLFSAPLCLGGTKFRTFSESYHFQALTVTVSASSEKLVAMFIDMPIYQFVYLQIHT